MLRKSAGGQGDVGIRILGAGIHDILVVELLQELRDVFYCRLGCQTDGRLSLERMSWESWKPSKSGDSWE